MKTVYSQTNCPACERLKRELELAGEEFNVVMIGKDISKDDFFDKFPNVRSVPYVVNNAN
jgi:glutaredoxin